MNQATTGIVVFKNVVAQFIGRDLLGGLAYVSRGGFQIRFVSFTGLKECPHAEILPLHYVKRQNDSKGGWGANIDMSQGATILDLNRSFMR